MPPKDVSSTLYRKVMDVVRTPLSGARKVSPSIKVVSGAASCSRAPGGALVSLAAPGGAQRGLCPLPRASPHPTAGPGWAEPCGSRRSSPVPQKLPPSLRARLQVPGLSRGRGVAGLCLVLWEGAAGAGPAAHLVEARLCSSICPRLSTWRPPARLSSPARRSPLKSDGRPSMVRCRGRGDKKGRAYWRLAGPAGPGDAACRPRSPR